MELTRDNFNDVVDGNKYVLVDFWAEWCGPCKALEPIFEDVAKDYNEVTFARLNIDDYPDVANFCNVRGIPTLIMFKDGIMENRRTGFMSREALEMLIKSNL